MEAMTKTLAWRLGVLLSLLGVVPVYANEPAATTLETVPATLADLPRIYRLDGIAEATNRSTVSAQTSGRVVEVDVDVDDYVQAGDVIVRLDGAEQRAALRQAEAQLAPWL